MIYAKTITTPVNTAATAPLKTALQVTAGLVYKLEIQFPIGSAGLAGLCILDGGFQAWPSTLGEWFIGSDVVISFDDVYLKEAAPYTFDIFTYNLDTVYEHDISVRVGLVSKDIFMARFLPSLSYKYFVEAIKELSELQASMRTEQELQLIDNPFAWITEG